MAVSAAEVYDEFFAPALFDQWPEQVLDAAAVAPGKRVLDVGCGTGILTRAAAGRVGSAGHVVGLDPNPGMLTVARRSAEAIDWREGVAESLPFEDGSFHRVVSQFAAMFFTDADTAISEMARVLAPSGKVAIATWAPSWSHRAMRPWSTSSIGSSVRRRPTPFGRRSPSATSTG
jgi:ubiquinone/menaquinone biosynthesis C-methylase UbiE